MTSFSAIPSRFRQDAARVYDWMVFALVEDNEQNIARWGEPLSPRYGYSQADVLTQALPLRDLSSRRIDAIFRHLKSAGLIIETSSRSIRTERRARMGTVFHQPYKTVHGEYTETKYRPVGQAAVGLPTGPSGA